MTHELASVRYSQLTKEAVMDTIRLEMFEKPRNELSKDEKETIAELSYGRAYQIKNMVDALLFNGFNRDEAMQIVCRSPMVGK